MDLDPSTRPDGQSGQAGGYVPRFLSFFLALVFFRFDGESQSFHLPLTPAVRRLAQPIGKSYLYDEETLHEFKY